MALIKCPDCGKMFSEYANNCPICGCPAKDAKTIHDTRKRQQRIDDFIASKPQELQKSIELHEQKLEEVKKLICPNCGKDIHPGNTYCPSCGSRIRFDEKPKEIERTTPASSVSQGAQQPIKKKTWLWVAIFSTISVLAVAVLVLAYFFILPMFSNQSTNGEDVSTENAIVDESSDMYTSQETSSSSALATNPNDDLSWLYGTWECTTEYGTERIVLTESSITCIEGSDIEKSTYYIDGSKLRMRCAGYTTSWDLDFTNHRIDMGEGHWMHKISENAMASTIKQTEGHLYSENETQYDFVCKRLLTDSDLIGLSKKDLRIMRNWIYARHGYIFKSLDLQEYFDHMSWYHPQNSDVSNMLSEVEKDNVYKIRSYE